jgi:hypothetical protein
MLDLWDRVIVLLIFVRDQCMPVAIGDTPRVIDYAIVALAAGALVGGTLWFVWGLLGRDSARNAARKALVLED